MGYGSSPIQSNPNPNQNFQETAYVQDRDTYQPTGGTGTVILMNSAIEVVDTINSGTVLSVNTSFNATTGTKTYTYVIKAKNTPGVSHIDEFYGKDLGTVLKVKDANTGVSQNFVTIGTPQGGGGEGDGF